MIYLRWPTTVTAKPKTSQQKQNTSRQNRKPHGKNKSLTGKPKTSRQIQRPHGKTKYFRAKTKYLTAKANTHGKTKAILLLLWSIWFCREVFGFAVRYFVFCYYFLRRLFAKHQTLSSSVSGVGFSVAGLDRAKLGVYQFQSFLFIVVIVIWSILLKPTFWQISIYSQSLVKIL